MMSCGNARDSLAGNKKGKVREKELGSALEALNSSQADYRQH